MIIFIDLMIGYFSASMEPEMRSPRARLLWDKWRHVWMLAWERQKRLHDHLLYLQELERVRRFSWDDWRKRVCFLFDFEFTGNINVFFTVLEIHESLEIQTHRFVPENG